MTPRHSGLRLSVCPPHTNTAPDACWDGALAALALCGLLFQLRALAGLSAGRWAIAAAGLLALISAGLAAFPRTARLRWVPCAAGIAGLLPFGVLSGGVALYNGVLDGFGIAFGRMMPLRADAAAEKAPMFLLWVGALLVLPLLSAFRAHRPLLPAFAFGIVLTAACVVDRGSAAGTLLWLLALISGALRRLETGCLADAAPVSTNSDAGVEKPAHSFRFRAAALALAACCIGGAAQLPAANRRTDAEQALHTLRYGADGVLPEGDLRRAGSFAPSDATALEVVMSDPQSCWLRGFVGETYTGSGWAAADPAANYAYAGLFYWLHQSGFYGQTQLAQLAALFGETDVRTVRIRTVGASRAYAYAPYELYSADASLLPAGGIGDCAAAASGLCGAALIRYELLPNQVKRYPELAAALNGAEQQNAPDAANYLNAEAHYNEYVYATDCALPDSARTILRDLLGEWESEGPHLDTGAAKQRILSYLTQSCVYDTAAQAVGSDALTSFLVQNRRGWSVHFATAAVLMFRYFGIPARYVEGYRITPADAAGMTANAAFAVTEGRAHAWAEFYQDGVGWIPFEATPPFLDEMEQADTFSNGTAPQPSAPDPAPEPEQPDPVPGSDPMTEQRAKTARIALFAVLGAGSIAGLLIALLLALRALRRRRRWRTAFASPDARVAVKSLFAYSAGLLEKRRVLRGNEIYHASAKLDAQFGGAYRASYEAALPVYEKAAFGTASLSDAERHTVQQFQAQTEALCRPRCMHPKGGARA